MASLVAVGDLGDTDANPKGKQDARRQRSCLDNSLQGFKDARYSQNPSVNSIQIFLPAISFMKTSIQVSFHRPKYILLIKTFCVPTSSKTSRNAVSSVMIDIPHMSSSVNQSTRYAPSEALCSLHRELVGAGQVVCSSRLRADP